MSNFRQSLSDDEKRELRRLLQALEPFRATRTTMSLQNIYSFLLVALDEGRGVTEYAVKSDISQSVMSRHLLDIGDRNRHMEAGFGWITQRSDPLELRKHQVLLSDKGKALAHRVIRALHK